MHNVVDQNLSWIGHLFIVADEFWIIGFRRYHEVVEALPRTWEEGAVVDSNCLCHLEKRWLAHSCFSYKVWSLSQFSMGPQNLRNNENKFVFNKRTIKVCVSCSWQCPATCVSCHTWLNVTRRAYRVNFRSLRDHSTSRQENLGEDSRQPGIGSQNSTCRSQARDLRRFNIRFVK